MSHLLPKGKTQIYDRDSSLVQVMTKGGDVVSLPYDLRVGFARFLARSKILNIKRYSIDKVFREVKVRGIHPREQEECAFDIVGSSGRLADSEVLFVVDELLRELPGMDGSSCYFRLNHMKLLQGILAYCGVPERLYSSVYGVIREGDRWGKSQRIAQLVELGLSEQCGTSLINYLENEGTAAHVGNLLRHIVRSKKPYASDVKAGLSDLEFIVSHAKAMGVKCEMKVFPSLVYNPGHFSGMVCQLVRRKKRGHEIMAAGGRYDTLVQNFAISFNLADQQRKQPTADVEKEQAAAAAVGISLSMERLVAALGAGVETHFSAAEVVVYPQNTSSRERSLGLVSKLWSLGIRCVIADSTVTLDEAQESAFEFSASLIVIVREGDTQARVRFLEKEQHIPERRVRHEDLVDFLQRAVRSQQSEHGSSDSSSIMSAQSVTGSGVTTAGSIIGGGGGFMRSESTKTSTSTVSGEIRSVQVNYNYTFLDKTKVGASAKKRLESTISTKLTSSLGLLAPGTVVEALALHLPKPVLKSISGLIDLEGNVAAFDKSVAALQEKHPRHRKDLGDICDTIRALRQKRGCSVFALYSCEDHFFNLMIPS